MITKLSVKFQVDSILFVIRSHVLLEIKREPYHRFSDELEIISKNNVAMSGNYMPIKTPTVVDVIIFEVLHIRN